MDFFPGRHPEEFEAILDVGQEANMKAKKMQGHRMMVLTVFVMLFISWAFPSALYAENLSPVGYWKTIDDNTGEVNSFVRIWTDKGTLYGKIEKLIRKPGQDPNPICKKCSGERKDQPIQGMTFLWGFTQDEDEWSGGYIMNPNNGKNYRCIVKVIENGRKLYVRGYILFSIFGVTEVWHRAD